MPILERLSMKMKNVDIYVINASKNELPPKSRKYPIIELYMPGRKDNPAQFKNTHITEVELQEFIESYNSSHKYDL